jgi:chromosome segregation ATPase
VVEYTRRISSEREKNEKEIASLKRQLEEKDNSSPGKEIATLQAEIARVRLPYLVILRPSHMVFSIQLKAVTEDLEEALKSTRTDLEDKDRDLRDLKKRIRDVPVVNGALDTSKGLSPSSSKDGSKNELAGMK